MSDSNSKRVLMLIAHHNFRDEEYNATRKNLEKIGAKITVASTVKKGAIGYQGMVVDPDMLIDEVTNNDYDAVIFIGGSGASQYWHDVNAHRIAKSAADHGKLLAAISQALVTLAVAGLLKDKKVTGHVSIYEKLMVHGAHFTGSKLEKDGNLITASGPNAAKEFAETIANSLN